MDTVRCGQCKTLLDEPLQTVADSPFPCPKCGSTLRLFDKTLAATVTARASLGLKARESGRRKPFLEQISGASYFRKAQRWVERLMRIDRRNNQYREVVNDPETGAIIHKCEEPLSKHRGHGDARKKDVHRVERAGHEQGAEVNRRAAGRSTETFLPTAGGNK